MPGTVLTGLTHIYGKCLVHLSGDGCDQVKLLNAYWMLLKCFIARHYEVNMYHQSLEV